MSKILTGKLALGYKIADEIGANEDRNTTGRWIAHYLAERLEDAQNDPTIAKECFELVVKLWQSRRNWPSGDPLSKYDALLPKFDLLLGGGEGRFFSAPTNAPDSAGEADELMETALKIDRLSSALIWDLVKDAVKRLGVFDDDWLENLDEDLGDSQLEFLLKVKDWANKSPPDVSEKLSELRTYLENEKIVV